MRASEALRRILVALLPAVAFTVAAAPPDKAQKEEMRRLLAAQRKLTQEKSDLERAKADLETQARESAAKLEAARRSAARAAARSATMDEDLRRAREEQAQTASRLDEATARLAEQQRARAAADAQIAVLKRVVAAGEKHLAVCEDKNLRLYRYGRDMAVLYQKKGAFDALWQGEPFTGIGQVDIENLLEEYRERLDGEKLDGKASR